jgi:mitochondrial fission protein ELM1
VPPSSAILIEDFAGLRAQARGLAEAAGLRPDERTLRPRFPWRHLAPGLWPAPLSAVEPEAVAPPWPDIVIGCGGKSAAVLAALRRASASPVRTVIIQHPRMDPRKFDFVVAGRHDGLTGPNVFVARTAMHRVTQARLAEAASLWRPRLAHLPRPLVAVLLGGSNGRYRLGPPEAATLGADLLGMVRRDRVGLAITPSRRTDPAVTRLLAGTLAPHGAFVWDFSGDNPYLGLLALADAIVVTCDSVSMMSEAAATSAPVLVVKLPGRSRRQDLFRDALQADGRIRPFRGRFDRWDARPIDDTPAAAAELRRRLGYG